jgi:predicted RNase H-like nuclease
MTVTFVGFDSAWTDNPAMPGAICSLCYDGQGFEVRGKQIELVARQRRQQFVVQRTA